MRSIYGRGNLFCPHSMKVVGFCDSIFFINICNDNRGQVAFAVCKASLMMIDAIATKNILRIGVVNQNTFIICYF